MHNASKAAAVLAAVYAAVGAAGLLRPDHAPRTAYWLTLIALTVGDIAGDVAVGMCLDAWAFGPDALPPPPPPAA